MFSTSLSAPWRGGRGIDGRSPTPRPLPQRGRILLLQGPAGPFFRNLDESLTRAGFAVDHVVFNAGDRLFARRRGARAFTGTADDWDRWLTAHLAATRPDSIVLFGAMRPAHVAARKIADALGIPVVALEEGYLRTGFITCETGGNNLSSPLRNWHPDSPCAPGPATAPPGLRPSPLHTAAYAAVYYLVRDLFATPAERSLFHSASAPLLHNGLCWARHYVDRVRATVSERGLRRRLKTDLAGRYLLVPLQVPTDSQLRFAGRGWSNERLIAETLRAHRVSASKMHVVFKLHPLDRDSHKTAASIARQADRLQLSAKVAVLRSGRIGPVTKTSAGMIVINSTSALSALRHDVPLLVLGDAVFRHPTVATLGDGPGAIADFIRHRAVANPDHVLRFFEAMQADALLPGDFYVRRGRLAAARAITGRLSGTASAAMLEAAE